MREIELSPLNALGPRNHINENRGRSDSRQADAAQHLVQLREEMRTHQMQMQQLNDAHEAVQKAVSSIGATKELLNDIHNTNDQRTFNIM